MTTACPIPIGASEVALLELSVERLFEPYTGMSLLGVGGLADPRIPAFRIDIRYDDQPASTVEPTLRTVPNEPSHWHFATQLPLESSANRVRIVLILRTDQLTIFDQALNQIGEREAIPTPLAESRVQGVVKRSVRSVTSGEVFSLWRWQARAGRFAGLMLRAKQKVRYKLLGRQFRPRAPHDTYVANTSLTPAMREAMIAEANRFRVRPTISVLLPMYNSDPVWLAKAIDSVRAQLYDCWELCLADDASTDAKHRAFLDRLPADPRIKLARRTENGHISANTNSAAELATGEFVALLDHDDELASEALFEIVKCLQDHADADLIYSDEDKIDATGHRYDPQFKPDWSPELLLSYNYINHFTCIRRTIFERAGRFRVGYEGSQDHDLLLRVTELTDRIQHVPRILYHWRSLPTSTASTAGVKTYVHTSGRRAVDDALQRRRIAASLYVPAFAERLGLPVLALDGTDDGPSVAIVVRGDSAAAGRTVRAIRELTAYRKYIVYLAVDGAAPAEAMNRIGAGRSEDLLLFLDAGLEPTDSRWLSRLVAYLQLPGVGAVGGLIRDPQRTIVSAGTLLGMHDGIAPGHAACGTPADGISYYFYAEVARNVSAPGRGCLLTRRDVFDRLGGFDVDRFADTMYDVDFAMRLDGIGLRSVHVAGAELRRPEPAAERTDDPLELRAFQLGYGRPRDPYSNPNFSDRDSFRPLSDAPASLPAIARSSPVRALVAAHNLNTPEGAPRYLSEIVLGLVGRRRITPTVFSPLGGAGEAVYRDAAIPVTVANEPWSRRFVDGHWTPAQYEAAQQWLANQIRQNRPEVVIANTLLTFPVIEAATRAGVSAVWIIHESYSADVLARVFPPYARARIETAFALAARVIPASHDTAALFAHWNTRGNFRVLHNGLDVTPFDQAIRRTTKDEAARGIPGEPGKKRIIAVGTVCERKGQHTLVEAAAKLARTRSDFACYLVGVRREVPYANYVRELVRRHRLERIVHLIEETDDVWRFYRAADVFACTSHMETFSRAVLEAEAFGLPIVSTPCCGLSEQVFWNYNALQFGFGDADGLANQLGRLLSDDPFRSEMAKRSRAAFDVHLTDREMLDRYEAVILSAARVGSSAGSPIALPSATRLLTPGSFLRRAG